ncbi:Mu transposase C-terminal domain-containing protein [Thalassospira marina]|nr:Mu transposase C-terminal domain-containing protein [Thalassospira marina]
MVRVAPICDLPPSLYEKARALIGSVDTPQKSAVSVSNHETTLHETGDRMALAMWRLEIIQPALAHGRGTASRKATAQELAGKRRQPDGKVKTVSERTIYNWIKRYEDGGIAALANKPSNAKSQPRVLVTRKWDDAVKLPSAVKQGIADELQRYIRSLWSNGTAGWRHVCQLSSAKLMELTLDAGRHVDADTIKETCEVNRSLAERWRSHSVVAVHDKDAKAYFDKFLPRVSRNRLGLKPMDIVVGDVHHIDIYLRREDGTMATPKAIVWHDVATNRLYWTLILLGAREGVRRFHVAASFASMCSQWGLPKRLYLDNGSEYNWAEMLNGFDQLAQLAGDDIEFTVSLADAEPDLKKNLQAVRQRVGKVIRSRPYNAPAKPVEGLFSNLEQFYLSAVDGWIGGDRMKSKTKNVGKAPEPFPGDFAAFHETIADVLAYYHATPQRGWLAGKSPNDALQGAINDGWAGITQVEEKALLLAFAREDYRMVDRGRISWAGQTYYADELLRFSGRKVRIRVADHNPDYAFIFDGERLIAAAERDTSFGFLDAAGAREQARRAKEMRRVISEMKRDCDRLDLISEMGRFAATSPIPALPTANRIDVAGDVQAMITETKKFEHRQTQKAVAATSSKPLKNQWGVEDEAFSDLYD